MRWQKAARFVVAAAGLGTVVALFVLTRERPETTRPGASSSADPEATVQAGRGVDQRFRGSDRVGEIAYDGIRQYPDGRIAWTGAKLTMSDGALIGADLIESKGRPSVDDEKAEYTLNGNVQFQSPEGATFKGESGTFNNGTGLAKLVGPVTFARGRMTGTGTDATYERETGVFKILSAPVVTTAPDAEGKGQVKATSTTMTFMSTGNSMLFDGNAKIERTSETLAADRATLYLADDEEGIRVIELRGRSQVNPTPGSGSGVPGMRAGNIDLAFHPETGLFERAILQGNGRVVMNGDTGARSIEGDQITMAAGSDGSTITQLDARNRVVVMTPAAGTTPARTIRAATLNSSGNDKDGLTAALFSGGVEFTETVPSGSNGGRGRGASATRTGTSASLALAIRGQIDAIDEAEFRQNVRFRDGDVVGDADLGRYQAVKGVLDLLPAPKSPKRPSVTDGSVTVEAAEIITVQLGTHDLSARREVKTVRQGSPDSGDDGALFNGRDPIYGFSTAFTYTSATKTSHYTGTPARLQQGGDSLLSGREITITDGGEELDATGATESVVLLAASGDAPSAGKPERHTVKADSLKYVDSSRKATYVGAPAVLTNPQGETRAQQIVFTLQKGARRLDQLEATGSVQSTMQNDRRAVGDVLVYEAVPQRYTLRGRPAMLRTREKDGTCKESRGAMAHFDRLNEVPEWRPGENPGGTKNADVSCSAPITP